MPIYEYKCGAGHITERLELISRNEDVMACPECHESAHKIFSRTYGKMGKLDNGIHVTTTKSDTW